MKTNLLSLERAYLTIGEKHGYNTEQIVIPAMSLANELAALGKRLLARSQHGELYFKRAIDILRPLPESRDMLLLKYQCYLLMVTVMERDKQFESASQLLTELFPLLETKDRDLALMEAEVLFHMGQCGRKLKMVECFRFNEETLKLLQTHRVNFETFKTHPQRMQNMLCRVCGMHGKYLRHQDDDRGALQMYFQAYKVAENALGMTDKYTMKCRSTYQELAQMLDMQLMINEIESETLPPQVDKVATKNYNVMVNQLFVKTRKLKVPTMTSQQPQDLYKELRAKKGVQLSKYSRPTSASTATKLASPSRIMSALSRKPLIKSNRQSDYLCLEDANYKQDIMDFMIMRPFSSHVPEVIVHKISTQKHVREPSKQIINPQFRRRSTNMQNVPSFQVLSRESQKRIPAPKEVDVPKISSSNRQPLTVQSLESMPDIPEMQIIVDPMDSHRDPSKDPEDSVDPILAYYLTKYSLEYLNAIVNKIVELIRRIKSQPKVEQTKKLSPNKQLARGSTIYLRSQKSNIGFVSLMNNLISENETVKAMQHFFESALGLDLIPIYFYERLFLDAQPQLWCLNTPRLRVQCSQALEEDSFGEVEDLSELDRIRHILSSNTSSKAMHVVGTLELEQHAYKCQFRFTVDNIVSYAEDLDECDDMIHLYDQFITLYMKDKGIYFDWEEQFTEHLLFQYSCSEYSQELLSKVLYLLRISNYVKSVNGFKFKEAGYQYDSIVLQKNIDMYKQRKQQLHNILLLEDIIVSNKPIKIQQHSRIKKSNNKLIIYNKSQQVSMLGMSSPSQSQSPYTSQDNSMKSVENDTPIQIRKNERFSKFLTPNWKEIIKEDEQCELTDIYSLEMQDFLQYYFPEFKLAIPNSTYEPQYVYVPKPKRHYIDGQYFQGSHVSIKQQQLQYQQVLPMEYLILTQIIKIDGQFYLLKLTNKLHLEQLVFHNKWSDDIPITLSDLIPYQIGRTGYVMDLVKLQEKLASMVSITNTHLHFKEPHQSKLRQSDLTLLLNLLSEQQNTKEFSRNRDIDTFFLLTFNKYVVGNAKNDIIETVDNKVMLSIRPRKRQHKFASRLALSQEDDNKHILRTNEYTISGDVDVFTKHNSVFMLKQLNKLHNIKLTIQNTNIYADYRKGLITATLQIYNHCRGLYSVKLNQQLLEKWAHYFILSGKIRDILLAYSLKMKKTLIGYKFYENNNRISSSTNPLYLLLQDKLNNVQRCFLHTKIQNKGVFIQISLHMNMLLLRIMPEFSKTKQFNYIHIEQADSTIDAYRIASRLSKYFIFSQSNTYQQLELQQITTHSIRKRYLLSNVHNQSELIVASKPMARVVCKFVKRIDRQFVIITVIKTQECFQVYIYNQSNSRRFAFRIHGSDFGQMNQYFLDSIFPYQEQELVTQMFRPWKLNEIQKIYQLMRRNPEVFKLKTKKYIREFNTKHRTAKRSNTQVQVKRGVLLKSATMTVIEEEPKPKTNWFYTTLLQRKEGSTFEMRIWLELLDNLTISANTVLLDKFKAQLVEIHFSSERVISYQAYMPCEDIKQPFRWQPTRFRVYYHDSHRTLDAPLFFRGKQVQMAKHSLLVYNELIEKNKLPLQQDYIRINKPNDKMHSKYQLLFKSVLTITNTQMVAILHRKELLYFRMWSNIKSITRKMQISEVEHQLPHIRQLLSIDPLEAGKRLLLAYKNQLIHAAYGLL